MPYITLPDDPTVPLEIPEEDRDNFDYLLPGNYPQQQQQFAIPPGPGDYGQNMYRQEPSPVNDFAPHEKQLFAVNQELSNAMLSKEEQKKLAVYQNAISGIQEQVVQGELDPLQAADLIGQANQAARPLMERAARVPVLARRARMLEMQHEAAMQEGIVGQTMQARAAQLPMQIATVANPATGEVQQLYPPGWQPLWQGQGQAGQAGQQPEERPIATPRPVDDLTRWVQEHYGMDGEGATYDTPWGRLWIEGGRAYQRQGGEPLVWREGWAVPQREGDQEPRGAQPPDPGWRRAAQQQAAATQARVSRLANSPHFSVLDPIQQERLIHDGMSLAREMFQRNHWDMNTPEFMNWADHYAERMSQNLAPRVVVERRRQAERNYHEAMRDYNQAANQYRLSETAFTNRVDRDYPTETPAQRRERVEQMLGESFPGGRPQQPRRQQFGLQPFTEERRTEPTTPRRTNVSPTRTRQDGTEYPNPEYLRRLNPAQAAEFGLSALRHRASGNEEALSLIDRIEQHIERSGGVVARMTAEQLRIYEDLVVRIQHALRPRTTPAQPRTPSGGPLEGMWSAS